MAFKTGAGNYFPERTLIDDDHNANLNYIDSLNDVTFEDGNIVLDLSKGNMFRMPTFMGQAYGNQPFSDLLSDSQDYYINQGIVARAPSANDGNYYTVSTATRGELTFKNWPPAGQVKKVSLVASHVPRDIHPQSSLGYYETKSLSDSCKYKFEYFDISKHSSHATGYILSKKKLSGTAPANGGTLVVSHAIDGYDFQTLGTTLGSAVHSLKLYPHFLDSADESTINGNDEKFFWNGDGTAVYLNNQEEDTFIKFPLSKRYDLSTVQKADIETIDYTAYTSNSTPNLREPVFQNNGYYLFALDYGMSGSGSNAYGVQSFRMSIPYDLTTIYKGSFLQLGNSAQAAPTGNIMLNNDGNTFYKILNRLNTNNDGNETLRRGLTTPFNLDDGFSYTDQIETMPCPRLNTADSAPNGVTWMQMTGQKNDIIVMLENGTYGQSRRFYARSRWDPGTMGVGVLNDNITNMTNTNTYNRDSGQYINGKDFDITLDPYLIPSFPFDSRIKVDSSFTIYDSDHPLYLTLMDSAATGVQKYRGHHNLGNIPFPTPDGVNYYEFLVFDSNEGAILTNMQVGLRNTNKFYTTTDTTEYNDNSGLSGEAIFTEPGYYKWVPPLGVERFSVVAVGGGCGGGRGGQTIISTNGDAKAGTGGRGGMGGMLSYKHEVQVGSHGWVWVYVGKGGDAPYQGDSNVSYDDQDPGSASFICNSESLLFTTRNVLAYGGLANGANQTSPSVSSQDGYAKGGDGGFVSSSGNTSFDPANGYFLVGGGGGGGAGGYTTYGSNSHYGGKGGEITSNTTSDFYKPQDGYSDYFNQGHYGGGGGGAGGAYGESLTVRGAAAGRRGGGVSPYGRRYLADGPTGTRIVGGTAGVNGREFTQYWTELYSELQLYYAANAGNMGEYQLGLTPQPLYGGGGGGNAFEHTTGSNDSRLHGGTAGMDGVVRIIWGDRRGTFYNRTGTTQYRRFPDQKAGHEYSHVIYENPGKIS